jgi:UDP-GlcNAc:undecaprenyl-phosphate GlcNAc-1-phosphate transferase
VTFYVLIAVIAAVVSFGASWAVLRLSHRFKLYPDIRDRDVHTEPTPRLGGIAIVTGVLVALAVASQISWFRLVYADPFPLIAIVIGALVMLVIGVVDDLYDLDWLTKLAGQLLVGGFLAWAGVQIVSLPIGGITILSPTISLIITVLAVVLVMNAVNFIDGLDGLVAGVTLLAGGVFFIYSYVLAINTSQTAFNLASLLMAVLLGATAGFLPFNWHPAKIFMGDGGALVVGLLLAVSTVTVTGQINPAAVDANQLLPAFIPLLLPFAVLIVPLLDFGLAVLRRLRAGKSPFSADRKHLHHRLLDMGHSHFHAVLIFYAWTAVFAIGTLLFMFVPWGWALAALVIGVVVCSFLTFAPLTRVKRRAPDLLEAGSLDADVPGTGWRGTTIPDAAASDTPVETSR